MAFLQSHLACQAHTQVVEKVGYILFGTGFACTSAPPREVWGHAPPGKLRSGKILDF